MSKIFSVKDLYSYEFFKNKRFYFFFFVLFGSFFKTLHFFKPTTTTSLNNFYSFYMHLITFRKTKYPTVSLFFFITDDIFFQTNASFQFCKDDYFESLFAQFNFFYFYTKKHFEFIKSENFYLDFFIFSKIHLVELALTQYLSPTTFFNVLLKTNNTNQVITKNFFLLSNFKMFLSCLPVTNVLKKKKNSEVFYLDTGYFKNEVSFRFKLDAKLHDIYFDLFTENSTYNINSHIVYFTNKLFFVNFMHFRQVLLDFIKVTSLNFVILQKKIKHFLLKKPSDLTLLNNERSLKNLSVLFIRKQKLFNKGRYSRNRQNYRTGVYWCLWINIIAVAGFYFWFYRFTMNITYLWWLFLICIFSFCFSQILKYNFFNLAIFYKELFLLLNWFSAIFFDSLLYITNFLKTTSFHANVFFLNKAKNSNITAQYASFEFFFLNQIYILI